MRKLNTIRKTIKPRFTKGIRDYLVKTYNSTETVRHKGEYILRDPSTNKSLGFPHEERERLDIRGLVPPALLDLDQQSEIIMKEYEHGIMHMAESDPSDEIMKSGVTPTMIRKWKLLDSIHNKDETLYYHLLMNNIKVNMIIFLIQI